MVTGQLLTDHLAAGGEGRSPLPCQTGLFPALPLWLYWWCQPQAQRPWGPPWAPRVPVLMTRERGSCLVGQPGRAQSPAGAQGSSRPAHPSDQISGSGPGMHLGFAVRGPQPGTGSWESSPDERGRINCPPVLVIPAMDAFWKVLWSRKTPPARAPPAPGIRRSRRANLTADPQH